MEFFSLLQSFKKIGSKLVGRSVWDSIKMFSQTFGLLVDAHVPLLWLPSPTTECLSPTFFIFPAFTCADKMEEAYPNAQGAHICQLRIQGSKAVVEIPRPDIVNRGKANRKIFFNYLLLTHVSFKVSIDTGAFQ